MNRQARRRAWKGGHVHRQSDGRDLYVIERQVKGERFHISTRAHSLKAAEEQLERFEANPRGYEPTGDLAEPLLLDDDLTVPFFEWLTKTKGNTHKYARECVYRLGEWAEDLGEGADLRNLTLKQLKAALAERAGQKTRIIALKSFFSWLRSERFLVERAKDPTLDLKVPAARPEQWSKPKAVPMESVRKAWKKLKGPYRDVLTLLAGTGMHLTELGRFVRHRDGAELLEVRRGGVELVVAYRHKTGKPVRTSIADPEVAQAARRLWKRQAVPRRLNKKLLDACRAANVTPFTFGVMRHSFATWADKFGVPLAETARALHHEDNRTTRRHYVLTDIPRPVDMPRLRLVR